MQGLLGAAPLCPPNHKVCPDHPAPPPPPTPLTVKHLLQVLLAHRVPLGHDGHHLLDLGPPHVGALQLPYPAAHVLQPPRRVQRDTAAAAHQDAV